MAETEAKNTPEPTWDPVQYERFKQERRQPFVDLLARVPDMDVRFGADLGCGTGELTRLLADRWPDAQLWAIDRSNKMLERTRHPDPRPGLVFIEADLRRWQAPEPLDLIFSNAVFQWVPDHADLLSGLASQLAAGGLLAVQVPNNRSEKAYRILSDLVESPRWKERLPARQLLPSVETAEWYARHLRRLGLSAEVWETIYYHQLDSSDAIVEWLKGTALRPILSALSTDESAEFLACLGPELSQTYKTGPSGVIFPFRRLFFVARRG